MNRRSHLDDADYWRKRAKEIRDLAEQVNALHTRNGSCASPSNLLRLLRTRRERPRGCRAAEQRDELAPFHCPMPRVLATERIAHLGTAVREADASVPVERLRKLEHALGRRV